MGAFTCGIKCCTGYSVPAFGVALRDEIAIQAEQWLNEVDMLLCYVLGISAHGDERGGASHPPHFLGLSRSIALYITGVESALSEGQDSQPSVARLPCLLLLREHFSAEIASNVFEAEEEMRKDAIALRRSSTFWSATQETRG